MRQPRASFDLAVVGSGFGGLATALRASELGARVLVLETVSYPGGCASTFERGGLRFEAGATLFAGLGPQGLFGRWRDTLNLDFEVDWPDPVVRFCTPEWELPIHRERSSLVAALSGFPGAPRARLARFFARQARVADAIWELLSDPRNLPPFTPATLARLAVRSPRLVQLMPYLGRSLAQLLRRDGLCGFEPLCTLADALCQITVQCPAKEAEAAFALAAMDYDFRDVGHVRGGIGRLAEAMVDAIRARNGEVHFLTRARRVCPRGSHLEIETKRGTYSAERVVLNLLPGDAARLIQLSTLPPRLRRLQQAVDAGYGAVMLYGVLEGREFQGQGPAHRQIVQNPRRPFEEGNHIFCSLGDEQGGPGGRGSRRTLTVSTHVALDRLKGKPRPEQAELIAGIQAHMSQGLARHAPDWHAATLEVLPGSPRTYQRFTGRQAGAVGGIPRRRGWPSWDLRPPPALAPGVYLVGDSAFPGQSTLAVALGGVRLADRLLSGGQALTVPKPRAIQEPKGPVEP